MPTPTAEQGLTHRKRISALLEGAIERSPADETELVWLEARHSRTAYGGRRRGVEESRDLTLLVRVIDHGRVGCHRIGAATAGDLDNAVRAAIAQSRAREPLPGLPHLPPGEGVLPQLPPLRDEAVSRLDAKGVERLVGHLRKRSDRARLRWSDARIAVFSSRGLRRGVSVSAIELSVRSGRGPGAGLAVDAARSLEGLGVEEIFARAHDRRGRDAVGDLPVHLDAAVLSPEASGALMALLNREAFSAAAYYEGRSLLRQHLGVQVFDRALNLRDDATSPDGLPFPFDLEGTPKRPVDLIEQGTPRTPALDQRQAAVLGLQPTGHAIAAADARAENLFLLPGEHDGSSLLGLADGGIWVGELDSVECYEPSRLQVRAILRSLRRIRDGRLAEPLPDMPWEGSLLRAFADISGVGSTASRTLDSSGYRGGISAPALAISLT